MTWRPPRSRKRAYVRAWVLRHRGIPARLAISAGRMLPSALGTASAFPDYITFVAQKPRTHAPLSTLNPHPRGWRPMTRGRGGGWPSVGYSTGARTFRRRVSSPALSVAGWGHSSALSHVSSRPPLSSVRRVFPGTASSNRHLPVWSGVFRRNTGVKTDPAIPLGGSSVYSILRLHHVQGAFPRLCVRAARHGVATCAQRSSLRVGCVVPPFIAWRPHPPVWRSPSHFPAPRL